MKINKVEIGGFLSIKKAEVDFDSYTGMTRIVGENFDTNPTCSNGAGKSSIIEAIVFALFGKTIRKTSEKSLVHSHSKSKCRVRLTVNDDVIITRTKKPPSLVVESGGENCTKEGILQTQEYLESILNTNYNVFLASIVFGQQNNINFLSASPDEKRSIIQNFLNVTDLFKYRPKIRSLKSVYNNDKKIASTLQSESLQKVKSIKKSLEKLRKERKQASDILSSEKKEFLEKYSFTDIQTLESQRLELELSCAKLSHDLTSTQDAIACTKNDINYYRKSGQCENCGYSTSSMAHKLSHAKDYLEASYDKRTALRKEIKVSEKEIDDLCIPITVSDYQLVENLSKMDVAEDMLKKQLRSQQRFSRKYSRQMAEAQKKYDLMRFWEMAFSEQGLVRYIIKNILGFFNERANFYLGILTRRSFFIEFNEALEEVIKNRNKVVFFEALSGGEKKKVSLAVMLALNDLLVLSGKDRSDIIFFDEVADSLDREGVKGLCDLMDGITEKKKLFIITHNEYLNSLIEDKAEILSVKKRKGITTFN